MKTRLTRAKIRDSLLSIAAGWLAAMAATLPMQFVKIVDNWNGGDRQLVWLFGAGTLVWAVWTMPLAVCGWLFAGLPVVAFVPDDWLRAHAVKVTAIGAASGWLIVLILFKVWRLVFIPGEMLPLRMFSLYSLLFAGFAGVAAWVYSRVRAGRDR